MVRCSKCNVFHIWPFCRFVYCLAWFDTVEFNRLPCPNDKKYDDVVFDDQFRYQLTMFRTRVLIGLSRLFHAHIAYETDTAKMIAAFCRISYYLHDLVRLNSTVWHVQTTRYTMMWFSLIDCVSIDYVWSVYIDKAISSSWYLYCIWNSYIIITTGNWHYAGNDLFWRTVVKRLFRRRYYVYGWA